MAQKNTLTLRNQGNFDVEEDCRSHALEYEDWEAIEKVSSLLWSNAALMGEFVFSEELRDELLCGASLIFGKILKNIRVQLSPMEEQILALAAIMITQEIDQSDESKLWDFIFKSLGHDKQNEKNPSTQQLYGRCREMFKDTINHHKRLFVEDGHKYYNTLKIHALTPAWSMDHLFNILYSFYAKNLESQYTENDNSFNLFVKNISARWVDQKESDAQLKLRSDTLASSFKMLFMNRPNYMAAVCDSLTHKIDELLKGNSVELDLSNRWDLHLRQWFYRKTEHEQMQMVSGRKRASRERVATKKEDIRPQFQLSEEDVYLNIPRIRLPEITTQPIAYLLQNDRVVDQIKMSVFGDDLCLTTRELQFPISYIKKLNFSQSFNFTLKIACGDIEIYNSGVSLFRKYILFNNAGQELNKYKSGIREMHLFTDEQTVVELGDSENSYLLGNCGQLYYIDIQSADSLTVGGLDILEGSENSDKAFYYMSEPCVPDALIERNGVYCKIFDKPVIANVVLPKAEQSQNYYLHINSTRHSLFEFPEHNGVIQVALPKATKYCHSVRLTNFSTGETLFDIAYMLLPDFSYELDRLIYFNKASTGTVKVRAGGNLKSVSFELEQNQKEIEIPLWADINCRLRLPKIEASLSGRNAFTLAEQCWFESFELGDFIQLTYPSGFTASLVLGSKEIPAVKAGKHYEFGNYIRSGNEWSSPELPLGLIIRHGGQSICQEFIASIVFQPTFLRAPITVFDRLIEWDASDIFIGAEDAEFKILLDNDEGEPWNYRATLKKDKLERNFPCRDGEYGYKIFLRGKESLFTTMPDKLLWEGKISVGDPLVSRFDDRELRLRGVCYWNGTTEEGTMAPIKDGDGILTDLYYIGTSSVDGIDGEYPEYEAVLYFLTYDGRWIEFNSSEYSVDYELINPVRLWVIDEQKLILQTRNGDAMLVNTNRPKTKENVRLVNTCAGMTKDEQYKYLHVADFFEYEDLPATER